MVVFPVRASLEQSVPALQTVPSSVENVLLATLVMGLHAKTLMNAKKSQMLATLIMAFIAVRTLSQDITVTLAPRGSLVLSPTEEEWSRQPRTNRFGLSIMWF